MVNLRAAKELCSRAAVSAEELDSRHGDPSKIGNWLRERDLARAVVDCVPSLVAEVERRVDLAAKVTKLEDLVRRQAMLITKLVREHHTAVEAAAKDAQ